MISILIPSRGRPQRLAFSLGRCFGGMNDHKRVEFLVRIDEDDPVLAEYKQMSLMAPFCKIIIGPRHEGYARNDKLIEECANQAKGDVMMQMVDTSYIVTNMWDAVLMSKINEQPKNGYFLMFPGVDPSGSYRFSFPTISRKLYEACGCFCLGENPSVDRCWEAFNKNLNLEIDSGIRIHHKELRKTKDQDQTAAETAPFYAELNSNWKERNKEFNAIGKRYADMVREKMNADSRL